MQRKVPEISLDSFLKIRISENPKVRNMNHSGKKFPNLLEYTSKVSNQNFGSNEQKSQLLK